MQRISPVLVFCTAALAAGLALSACSDDGDEATSSSTVAAEEAATTTLADDDTATTESSSAESSDAEASTDESTTTAPSTDDEDTATTEAPAEEPADEVGALCDAYLESISIDTAEEGLATLTEILGPDAPSGVQLALETLRDPAGDIEGFFAAQNSVDGYVLPICRDRFSRSIVPAADDAAAADSFLAAVRDGDVAGAEQLAPTNVIVSFDWNGFPDATSEFSVDNSTMTMVLEPTVTVFCQIDNGAVEFCAFGE